jgi:ABC-type nitrate/sulfonate/bicarbonate transport system substrate-binding protein
VRKTIAAVLDAVAWQRANRAEAVKMIAARYKISPNEAERSYQTMIEILSPDGSMDLKKVRGYLNLLREERPIAENLEAEKLVDFSMLPSAH